jgi:predicted helicase
MPRFHHPTYRRAFTGNWRRELPRLPYAEDFHAFARAGERLAALHTGYELAKEFPLRRVEKDSVPLDQRVERIKLASDRLAIVYNNALTLERILRGPWKQTWQLKRFGVGA